MLKNFLLFSLLIQLFIFSASARTLTRVLCSPDHNSKTSSLVTLHSEVPELFSSSLINVTDPSGRLFNDLVDFAIIDSEPLKMQTVILAQERNGPVGIYSAQLNIGRKTGTSNLLFKSRLVNPDLHASFATRTLPTKMMVQKGRLILAPAEAANEFVILDTHSNTQRTLRLRPHLFNPRFSLTSTNIIFDEWLPKKSIVRQVAFDSTSGQKVFETSSEREALFMEFHPDRQAWIWAELNSRERTAQMVIHESSRQRTLQTLFYNEARWPLVYSYIPGNLQILWPEISYRLKVDPYDGHQGIEITKAQVRQIQLGQNDISEKTFPFSQKILDLVSKSSSINRDFMSGGFQPTRSNEAFFPLGYIGGFAKLNLISGQWSIHALNARCSNATWAYEEIDQ